MNKIKDGMLLFHGSYTIVKEIDLEKCGNAKDFGKGFYLTSSLVQARSFIKSSVRKAVSTGDAPIDQAYGYVSSFRYYKSECSKPVCPLLPTICSAWETMSHMKST